MDQTVENSNPAAKQTPAETPMPVISSVEYSSNLSRFAAYLVDTIILFLTGAIISAPFAIIIKADSSIFTILPYIISIFYFSYFHSKSGQTVGMKFLGIKIINEDGSNLTFGGAFLRYFLCGILNFVTIGIASLWALFNPKKQTLYDLILKTIYIAQDEQKSRAKWVVGGYCCCGPILVGLGVAGLVSLGIANTGALNQVPGMSGSMPKTSTPSIPSNNSLEMTKPIQPTTTMQKPKLNQASYDIMDLETASPEIKGQVTACVQNLKSDPTVGKYDFTEFCKCAADFVLNMKKTPQESSQYCSTYLPEEVKNLVNNR
jgi:uncharacterized RDD family membrane protein YckC